MTHPIDDHIVARLAAGLAGRGRVVPDDAGFGVLLVPHDSGAIIAVHPDDDDSLLVRTCSGLRIAIPLDAPLDPEQPASMILAIVDGRLVELFTGTSGVRRLGYRLTYDGGALTTGEDLGPVTVEVPVAAWGADR